MVGLPRSIIKKYGVSKKAWAVFRGTKRRARHISRPVKTKVIHVMARRKHSGRSFRRSLKAGLSVKNVALGAAITAVVEPYFDSMVLNPLRTYIPAIPAGVAKALIGYYINKKMKGIVKGVGLSLMVLGINDTVQSFGIGLPQTTANGVIV